MRSYIQVIATPTADYSGALLVLHFDERRYLVGRLAEGSSRACLQRGVGLRHARHILLTGRSEWSNIGGMLGLILSLAQVQSNALQQLTIHGPPNLTHAVATARRFIFRKGLPLDIVEHAAEDDDEHSQPPFEPTWSDDLIRVHALSIKPEVQGSALSDHSRKRSISEVDGEAITEEDGDMSPRRASKLRKNIVHQMFNSDWRYDRLTEKPLPEVQLPAAIFVKDPDTKSLKPYKGPLPGDEEPVPDITVFVREPWPGSSYSSLPGTSPAKDSVSYIIRNHPQRGKFLPKKAQELGVPKGPLFSELTKGKTVQNSKGEDITPEMVLEPGKQGGGVAVIDLPSVDYVEGLVERPEWHAAEVMDGVELAIWILGPGVAMDPRLKNFQNSMSNIKHIMACPEYCSNAYAYDSAAKMALRHNRIDSTIFPLLETAPAEDELADGDHCDGKNIIPARRGLSLTLEPRIAVEEDKVIPHLDHSEVDAEITKEFSHFQEAFSEVQGDIPGDEKESWRLEVPCQDAEIIVLGTGSSHPSKTRNVSGILVRVPGCGSYLFDCGEGTLGTLARMFKRSELEAILKDLKMIWISHLHADHHLGTVSMIRAWHEATEQLSESAGGDSPTSPKLAVVSHHHMLEWLHEYSLVERVATARLLPLAIRPVTNAESSQSTMRSQLYRVTPKGPASVDNAATDEHLAYLNLQALDSVLVRHCRGAQAVSATFLNGLKVSYSGDCRPSANFAAIGRESHVLIHEATFEDDMRGEALAKKHSTTGEALVVACQMNARACLLTHFSQRYPYMPSLGAQIEDRSSSPVVERLEHVLEKHEEAGTGENADEPIDGPGSSTWKTSSKQSESLDNLVSATMSAPHTNGGATVDDDGDRVIDEADIKNLIARTGTRVVFAFDYMRLRLGDIPRLEKKQPLLREMYASGLGRDLEDEDAQPSIEEGEPSTGGDVKLAKSLQTQREKNKKKAKRERRLSEENVRAAQEKKWAEITAYVEEKKAAATNW